MKRFVLLLGILIAFQMKAAPAESNHVIVINPIEVPAGKESEALAIWDRYADYFRKQPGYLGTTLHEALGPDSKFHYINIAVWESAEAFMTALNSKELKSLGEGFPEDMPHYPSLYRIVRDE